MLDKCEIKIMTIEEAKEKIKVQLLLVKTPSGRGINGVSLAILDSALADLADPENDANGIWNEALECPGCQLVYPIEFSSNGCPNCGCISEIDIAVEKQ